MTICRRSWVLALLGSLLTAGLLAGCGAASLAADSASFNPGEYEVDSPQWVHVGETVKFDFLVKPQVDNYAVFQFPDGKSAVVQARSDIANYRAEHVFARPTAPESAKVTATGYRVRGMPDRMQLRGTTYSLRGSGDPGDQKIGRASIAVVVYQSKVQFADLAATGAKPDWARTTLRIIADDGKKVSEVRLAEGDSTGFRFIGPAPGHGYTLNYEPPCDQVNRGGKTVAELMLTLADGTTQALRQEFDTP